MIAPLEFAPSRAFEAHCRLESGGHTALESVLSVPPLRRDKMESFWLAETLKCALHDALVAAVGSVKAKQSWQLLPLTVHLGAVSHCKDPHGGLPLSALAADTRPDFAVLVAVNFQTMVIRKSAS